MSEPNNTFPFPGMEDSEELDVASIFGGGVPPVTSILLTSRRRRRNPPRPRRPKL